MELSDSWKRFNTGLVEWKNGRLIIYESMPTLLEISSLRVALEIWNDCVSRTVEPNSIWAHRGVFSNPALIPVFDYVLVSQKFVESLKIPEPVKLIIAQHFTGIDRKMRGWAAYLNGKVFNKNACDNWPRPTVNPEWLSWRSNGNIDYKTTVSNMLSTTKLDKLQKFIVMCKFCRFEDLNTVSLESLPPNFIESVTFDDDSLVFYWICYLRNELDKITLEDGATSIDARMVTRCQNIFAFEYFWNRLSPDRQIIAAMDMLKHENLHEFVFLGKFLNKMTEEQQYRVFCAKPVLIVKYLWVFLRKPDFAISIWSRVEAQCSGEQFSTLVQHLLRSDIIASEEDMRRFLQLWNETSDYLKRQVPRLDMNSVMKAFCLNPTNTNSGFEFLRDFLSLADSKTRKRAMETISCELVSHFARSDRMIDVINLCFPSEDERAEYLKSVLNMRDTRKRGLNLLKNERFEDLFLMLKIVSPDILANRKFVQRLLEFPEDIERNSDEIYVIKCKFIADHDKWTKLSKFIDETCSSDDPVWISNVKRNFVSSFAPLNGFFWHIKSLDELTRVLDEVFAPEEAQMFRISLLNIFRSKIIPEPKYWGIYDESNFVEFVSWCLDDATKVEEFKLALPRDAIVDRMFKALCDSFNSNHLSLYFEIMNKCLRFFFNADETKKYKISKIYEFTDEFILINLFQPDMEENLKLFLLHVFDNDAEELEKWRLSKNVNLQELRHSENDNATDIDTSESEVTDFDDTAYYDLHSEYSDDYALFDMGEEYDYNDYKYDDRDENEVFLWL